MSTLPVLTDVLNVIVPFVAAGLSLGSIIFFWRLTRFSSEPLAGLRAPKRAQPQEEDPPISRSQEGEPGARTQYESVREEAGFRQYALLREYHAQGLAQSRVSFWFSLTFASMGFAVIALAVGLYLQTPTATAGLLDNAGKPIFALVSGTIIDAVAALFFVQSNKARQLMTEFFDKLRTDRKLDESLALAESVSDPLVGSRLKALLALHFADVPVEVRLFEGVVNAQTGQPVSPVQNSSISQDASEASPVSRLSQAPS